MAEVNAPGARPLRVGLVGAGRIGAMHARILAHDVPGATLALVHDSSPAVAAATGAPVARSVEELVRSDAVDAVAICASTDAHADLVVAAAEAGKAIFCEKPLSLDPAEVDRALDAVGRAGVLLAVGFNRRFDPGHRSVRDAVAAGEVGEVHLVRISSRDPAPPPIDYLRGSGGLFLDMTIHDFDMARFVTGSPVVEVYAKAAVRVDPAIADSGDVDTAAIVLTHADGALTLIDNSRGAAYGYDQRVEAFGSAGMASSGNLPLHGGTVRTAAGSSGPPLQVFFLDRYRQSYVAQWQTFAAAAAGAPAPVDLEDVRAPLAVALAAQRSLREGRAVAVDELAAAQVAP